MGCEVLGEGIMAHVWQTAAFAALAAGVVLLPAPATMRRLVPLRGLVFLTAGVLLALFLFAPGQARAKLPEPIPKEEQKCIVQLNRGFERVARAQGKLNARCVRDAGRGEIPSAEACLAQDVEGKVQKAKDKNLAGETKRCTNVKPPFGATDAATGNQVGTDKDLDLMHALFGFDLDGVIIKDNAGAKCQAKVAKLASKCQEAKLRAFNKCKKIGLRRGIIPFQDDIDTCLGRLGSRKCDPVGTALTKCVLTGVDLSDAFPGCDTDDLAELTSCLGSLVVCRVCLALDAVDGLNRDCDLFDDGLANASCGECGNGVTEPWEECDGTDDSACPGACQSDCTCPPPPNDECTAATVISAFPFTDNAYTTKATVAVDDPLFCGLHRHSVWYTVTAPGNGTITADTFGSSYDTVLAALTGTCGTLTGVACNDDFSGLQSLISFAVTAGQTVFLEVQQYVGGSGGNLILNVVFAP